MRKISSIVLFAFLSSSCLYAVELQNISKDRTTSNQNIDRLVTQIKSAKPSQRRVLMNRLKVELRGMNQESRRRAMMKLRESFNRGEHHGKRLGLHRHRGEHRGQCEDLQRTQRKGKYQGEGKAKNRPKNSPKHNGQGKSK